MFSSCLVLQQRREEVCKTKTNYQRALKKISDRYKLLYCNDYLNVSFNFENFTFCRFQIIIFFCFTVLYYLILNIHISKLFYANVFVNLPLIFMKKVCEIDKILFKLEKYGVRSVISKWQQPFVLSELSANCGKFGTH